MKKLVFSLITTLFIGVVSISAQSMKPAGYLSLRDLGFGKISSYAGPCVNGAGVCFGSIGDSAAFNVGVLKVSENSISLAFSKEFYQENVQNLKNGLYIGTSFSLPLEVTQKIGINDEFVVATGNYSVVLRDGFYFVSLPRAK
jgi:hypothetical protein